MLVILVLTIFILCPDEGAAVKPGLKLTVDEPKHVKGTYQYNETLGIQFDIQPNSIKMKNLKGETLASYMKLARDLHYSQIADQGFLIVEKKRVRAVPTDLPKTRKALYGFADQGSSDEEENVKETQETALEKLRKFGETRLFEAACKAIANEGGSGKHPEITRPYHLMNLNLLKALGETGEPVHPLLGGESTNDNVEGSHHRIRTKRWWSGCKSLKKDPNNDNCYGMCGKGCKCWWWVCRNCCRNEGCAQHDYCCRKNWHSTYCQHPFLHGFSCKRYGGYSKC